MEAITMAAVGGTWEWVARRAGGKEEYVGDPAGGNVAVG